MIAQVGFDSNTKLCVVQMDWPAGATHDLTCFRSAILYKLLCSKILPKFMHIAVDEAYSTLSVECNNSILTPFSQHQLKPEPLYWKIRGFNHELSSECIMVERFDALVYCGELENLV